MNSKEQLQYNKQETKKAANFVAQLQQGAMQGGTFDSAAASDILAGCANQSGAAIPEKLGILFDEVGDADANTITEAILKGAATYDSMHGTSAPADVLEHAMHLAYATSDTAKKQFSLDSTSENSDALSLQPNRAVVAILSAMAEAIPFAHYLPADIGSNEAKLAILSHQAGSEYGAYETGGLMDGVLSGDAFITSSRVHATSNAAGNHTGQLTSKQATDETCASTGGNVVAVNLLRGRSVVYVNGQVVAREVSTSGAGNSVISGSVTIAGVTSQIGGTINTDTGVIAVTTTPALANGVPVVVEGYIDYERMPALTPRIITAVETYPLFAKPWRVTTSQSIDSRTQMSNELGLDPYSEGIIAIQSQFANERHYQVLRQAKRLGVNNSATFDFDWAGMGLTKTRAQVWQDFSVTLGAVSQKMAVDTLSHGVSHIYVGKYVMAQLLGLPRDLFEPSGRRENAGIFRVGRLFGRYEVYYTPKVLIDTASASQMLCVGRANDVTRNPFVLGDAVPPTVIPLAVNQDLSQGAGFYARNFTEVNPHAPSSLGCAMIDVINMGA